MFSNTKKFLWFPKFALAERDVIAQAQSGTGKTATFSVAVLQNIDETIPEVQALVMAPTRELAQQVYFLTIVILFKEESSNLGEE